MGSWGDGLFDDDTALDVREQFLDGLREGMDPAAASDRTMMESGNLIADEIDYGPIFWMALAATQWEYGCLQDNVRDQALALIAEGSGLGRWEDDPRALARRKAVYAALAEKLQSPQPRRRKPRRRKQVETPSKESIAPDGNARASVFSWPETPGQMQVLVEITVAVPPGLAESVVGPGELRSGGGVCSGDCSYDEIDLEWLEDRVLRITHPPDLRFTGRSDHLFVFEPVVQLIYRPRQQS